MNIDGIPIYRGKDERRESLIKEQMASGKRSVHPDDPVVVDGRCKKRTPKDRLALALKMANRTVSMRELAKAEKVCANTLYSCRDEYLAGELGVIDDGIAEKLKG